MKFNINAIKNESYIRKSGVRRRKISSAEGENIEYSFMGVQKSTSRMTISYGPGGAIDKEKGEYVGMLSFFEGDNPVIESKLDKVSQYVIYDDLSQEELDSFLQWISESFIDLGTMESFKKNECKGYRYKVTDNRFAVYCIANNSYCGSAAGRLLVRIRNYSPITEAAIPVLALCLYLMIAPRYVYAGSTAISLKNDLRSIFREV